MGFRAKLYCNWLQRLEPSTLPGLATLVTFTFISNLKIRCSHPLHSICE